MNYGFSSTQTMDHCAYLQVTLSHTLPTYDTTVFPSDLWQVYQGLHMAALTACGPGRTRLWADEWLLLRDWLSSLELRLYLRLWSFCWIWGKVLELCAQQLRQVGVTGAVMDCWTKLFTRWHAS